MTEKEKEYYSQKRCGTCQWHCRNCKMDQPREVSKGSKNRPWVCGNEKCNIFNKPCNSDTHKTCEYWEMRDINKWMAQYELMRLVKKPRKCYRNLIFMLNEIKERYLEEIPEHYSIEGAVTTVARYYGVSIKDIEYCLNICKAKGELSYDKHYYRTGRQYYRESMDRI